MPANVDLLPLTLIASPVPLAQATTPRRFGVRLTSLPEISTRLATSVTSPLTFDALSLIVPVAQYTPGASGPLRSHEPERLNVQGKCAGVRCASGSACSPVAVAVRPFTSARQPVRYVSAPETVFFEPLILRPPF